MNQKIAKKLKRLVAMTTSTNHPLGFDHERYQSMKKEWNNTPKNKRFFLMQMLETAANNLVNQSTI